MSSNEFTHDQRLKILTQGEIAEIYGHPNFSDDERDYYFTMTISEQRMLGDFKTKKSKVLFILQLGYFKARQQFFKIVSRDIMSDVIYIAERYFPRTELPSVISINKTTRCKQQKMILSLLHFELCDEVFRQRLSDTASDAAAISGKPIYIFRQIMQLLITQKRVFPAYTSLQDIVGKVLNSEQRRMAKIIQENLTLDEVSLLNGLLRSDSGIHTITQLKRDPRDFTLTEIKQEIQRGREMKESYQIAQRILPILKISNESIKYYASLMEYYSVYRLKNLDLGTVHLYGLCFIRHRYQRHFDNLLASFIFHTRKFNDAAKRLAKERVYMHRLENNKNLSKAAQILQLFVNDKIHPTIPFQEVQQQVFTILGRDKIESITNYIGSKAGIDESLFRWEHIDKQNLQFKRYLRPIVEALDFNHAPAQHTFMESIRFLQTVFSKGKPLSQYSNKRFPMKFLGEKPDKHLYCADHENQPALVPNRYEFQIYRQLRDRLEAGDIYCRDSIRFRSFEDDLIDTTTWKNQKELLIKRAGLPILEQPIEEHLAYLEEELETLICNVNQRISSGENTHIKIGNRRNQTAWKLPYQADDEGINHSIYNDLSQIDIAKVLGFANQQCDFTKAFEHLLDRNVTPDLDIDTLFAALIAWGTNAGIGQMAQVSDVDYNALSSVSENFIRLETLKIANSLVSNQIAQLPIFDVYRINNEIHSSSDGQKFETSLATINARHSPKYFGLKKGVVAYTLVADHVPINARIIGANEHESHYVFDLLHNNSSEIQPTTHSTDTHGTNEVNFAILHMFGYQFAPRYKDISGTVTRSLYGFNHPSQYNGFLKPIRKLKQSLIVSEWDWIQRIMVSLALKNTTQSVITSKLSSYARQNKTKLALWEYDNILKSLYLLRYVDESPLRKNVQLALNRGESYHKLRKAIAFASFGKLRFKSEPDQQIWQECSRLITNCIILYNSVILSKLLKHRQNLGDDEGIKQLKKVSPVAWQHINMHGRYEFTKNTYQIEIDDIIQELIKNEAVVKSPK